ncbi:MAG: hypothetical protein WBN09_01950 [Woeseiaceae bacterium]
MVTNSVQGISVTENDAVSGEFLDLAGERYYAIRNVDKMDPFFISVISDVDHWMFVSSNGGLTAGRVSPDTALFPYITVDKIYDSTPHTGSKTIFWVDIDGKRHAWEPFNREHDGRYSTSRNLYKNLLSNKLCFEEINHDLQLTFRYTWATSDSFGFVRQCELQNHNDYNVSVDIVDGLQNLLPAGTPAFAQSNTSNLVDAYKWSELDEATGLAFLTLYSGITDRAEPSESLNATTAFCLGLEGAKVLISSAQLDLFKAGGALQQEVRRRGVRCSYLVNHRIELGPDLSQHWQIVANLEQSQAEVVALRKLLFSPAEVSEAIAQSIASGSEKLARIMARGDAYQATAEENVTVHHYANVLFNILRGGVFDDGYNVSCKDFVATIRGFNQGVYARNRKLLDGLPEKISIAELLSAVGSQGDVQLERLSYEYLPITFGRRHGDPSRPWNAFAINVKDDDGNRLLSYQGNWRDIFQNWEALVVSYPSFVENVIAKFVNASTMDGYNPYRITKEGIDWEVEEPDNPWSYIGYWGDHQIIYLLKFLELSTDFHPNELRQLLRRPLFSYANVPYRIRPFAALLADPKHTVDFDEHLAEIIEQRITTIGADGKLVLDSDGEVYQVNLMEKLLVPLLAKLGNLVVDGGIWLNTQRPEWNDANNALVGHGLSMVTLYYLRRYIHFLQQLLKDESEPFALTGDVSEWLVDTAAALGRIRPLLGDKTISASDRRKSLVDLGEAASRYRKNIYSQKAPSKPAPQTAVDIVAMLDDALAAIDHTIGTNRRDDGLYHAYNLLDMQQDEAAVDNLYPMLEGQVAALSAGSIVAEEAVTVLEALFESDIYRPDQHTFMLYPDRPLPGFLDKNRISKEQVEAIPLLPRMLAAQDNRIVVRDVEGCYRFNADFTNVGDLDAQLTKLAETYGKELEAARKPLRALFEKVFHHKAFTGRSGTMFGFEGLGSVYWHMVSKLLLAVLENYFAAMDQGVDDATRRRLGQLYYQVRKGIGFNKTPADYGAFPTDPYSHTPMHAGAQQPGMTGQVKEEILCRFGELGVRVSDGAVRFEPGLLRAREFIAAPRVTGFVDVDGNWQTINVPANGLVFTWCQIPIVYKLDDDSVASITVSLADGTDVAVTRMALPRELSAEIFQRSGHVRKIIVSLPTSTLFSE